MQFKDRRAAGKKLAEALIKFKNRKDTVIVALPRGGVVVGDAVAEALGLPLDIVVPRKIAHPDYPEYAHGAITESGEIVWGSEDSVGQEWVKRIVADEKAEAQRRLKLYRQKMPSRDFSNKTVIVIDDGIATGLTMEAAIGTIKSMNPKAIVMAVPHGAQDSLRRLKSQVDEMIVLEAPIFYGAVGAFYEEFPQTSDQEVIEILNKYQ